MGTLERQINDLTRTIPGNNPEIFILYQFVPCTEKIIRPNKKWGKGGVGWGPEIGLKAFETFCHIFRNLWTSLDMIEPSTKNLQPLNKTILTGELVSDSDLYNIPNAFYQFFILKIL